MAKVKIDYISKNYISNQIKYLNEAIDINNIVKSNFKPANQNIIKYVSRYESAKCNR